ncbi:ADP-ribosylglycohydrolase family protein [Nostoc sphaeroides CCNUC1]|uniref:ADP-ribosylglycohydrolase family protein n=1 Tax=Nostoc sphaeroides CCNUC1 TaxID=2653204 RepID=A0A5P8W0A0_9NOSO|nr:ADP-ribosylglycohydrolase family protein [Nostoc sphaeroides CCNUC1]
MTAFKRDEREGYSRSFHHFLQEIQDWEEFLTKINPDIGVIF